MVSNWSCVAPRFSIAGILLARSLISLSLIGFVNCGEHDTKSGVIRGILHPQNAAVSAGLTLPEQYFPSSRTLSAQ